MYGIVCFGSIITRPWMVFDVFTSRLYMPFGMLACLCYS